MLYKKEALFILSDVLSEELISPEQTPFTMLVPSGTHATLSTEAILLKCLAER